MSRRIYIETSVRGVLAPGQDAEMATATRRFFARLKRTNWRPCVSDVVAMEIGKAPAAARDPVEAFLASVNPGFLPITDEVESLARRFVSEGVVPVRRIDDTRHVACATIHDCDYLASWNYRHIANVRKAAGFNAVSVLFGASGRLEIHTPLELLDEFI